MPKIIKIGHFLTELFKKIKGGRFGGHSVHSISSISYNEACACKNIS